ncbi:MAG: lactate utilization protein C [Syntrophobacteraceae bacterium]
MEKQNQTELFKQRAEAVQTVVTDVTSLQQAFQYAIDLTRSQGGTTIAAPSLGLEERSQLGELCQQAGITLLTEGMRAYIGEIQTGLTLGDWGVAETATLVLDSTSEDLRIATMLSETHVAVLPESRIKSDLVELESYLSETMKSAPRYLSFISGASRTADIERVLTIGVHGPQQLHVLILDEEPA